MKGLNNAGFGKKKFGDRGGYEDKEEDKPFEPGQGMGDEDKGGDEGIDHEKKETFQEEKKEEKWGDDDNAPDQETVDQLLDLYDQMTPLIEKLRKK